MSKFILNGIEYGGCQGGGSGINYSTEEQVIGTWIDGKPLYQKTYFYENNAIYKGKNELITELNGSFDIIIKVDAVITNSAHTDMRPLSNYTQQQPSDYSYYLFKYADKIIELWANDTWRSPNIIVTIQYTKVGD